MWQHRCVLLQACNQSWHIRQVAERVPPGVSIGYVGRRSRYAIKAILQLAVLMQTETVGVRRSQVNHPPPASHRRLCQCSWRTTPSPAPVPPRYPACTHVQLPKLKFTVLRSATRQHHTASQPRLLLPSAGAFQPCASQHCHARAAAHALSIWCWSWWIAIQASVDVENPERRPHEYCAGREALP